ncbi:MAG: MBL fold metallo-hydrolase, partial [bacterium]
MRVSSTSGEKIRLENDGELLLYFIGTGSAFTKTLSQNNLLIVKGNDHVLVDCGTKCSQSLHKVDLPLSEIENFLITHSHADHIGGLEEAQLHGRYISHRKLNMVINEE